MITKHSDWRRIALQSSEPMPQRRRSFVHDHILLTDTRTRFLSSNRTRLLAHVRTRFLARILTRLLAHVRTRFLSFIVHDSSHAVAHGSSADVELRSSDAICTGARSLGEFSRAGLNRSSALALTYATLLRRRKQTPRHCPHTLLLPLLVQLAVRNHDQSRGQLDAD